MLCRREQARVLATTLGLFVLALDVSSQAACAETTPLCQGVDLLEMQTNWSAPPGYTIQEAFPGELGETVYARTDYEEMTITVDVIKLEATLGEFTPWIAAGILRHEYTHTDVSEYNGGTTPDDQDTSWDPGGINNGPCEHAKVLKETNEFLCTAMNASISPETGLLPSEMDGLCAVYNNNMASFKVYNQTCVYNGGQGQNNMFGCAACSS